MVLLEILKYTLPSVVVFFTAYFILKQVFDRQIELQKNDLNSKLKNENLKILTPIRLQAYERMVMFLERIAPSNLILRHNKTGLTVFQFQTILIHAIREEFEHNLSQQLYLSKAAWEQIIHAKEEVVRQINTAASQLKSDENSGLLGQLIINSENALNKPTIKKAIDTLKTELEKNLG